MGNFFATATNVRALCSNITGLKLFGGPFGHPLLEQSLLAVNQMFHTGLDNVAPGRKIVTERAVALNKALETAALLDNVVLFETPLDLIYIKRTDNKEFSFGTLKTALEAAGHYMQDGKLLHDQIRRYFNGWAIRGRVKRVIQGVGELDDATAGPALVKEVALLGDNVCKFTLNEGVDTKTLHHLRERLRMEGAAAADIATHIPDIATGHTLTFPLDKLTHCIGWDMAGKEPSR